MSVDEGRAVALAHVSDRLAQGGVAGHGICPIHLGKMEVGEIGDQSRNVRPRSLHFDRNGNGVLIVLDQKQQRQLAVGCGIQGLPEFALAGSSVAAGDVNDLISVKAELLELGVVAGVLLDCVGMTGEIAARLRASHRLQQLRAGGRGAGDDVQLLVPPVRRHLPATGIGVLGGAHGLQQLLQRGHAEGETERAVAIVGEKPVVAGPQ